MTYWQRRIFFKIDLNQGFSTRATAAGVWSAYLSLLNHKVHSSSKSTQAALFFIFIACHSIVNVDCSFPSTISLIEDFCILLSVNLAQAPRERDWIVMPFSFCIDASHFNHWLMSKPSKMRKFSEIDDKIYGTRWSFQRFAAEIATKVRKTWKMKCLKSSCFSNEYQIVI